MKYQPVIGIEVHIELNTQTKMFCRCSADYFGKPPNQNVCPICLGLPGSLPMVNKQALIACIKLGLALNCQINEKSLFERKNYFYPDLPKGYQISQYRWPLATNGWIEVENQKGESQKIRINRVHQEEDTGKLIHLENITLVDFNRSGVPLVEIVTEPDFQDSIQVKNYTKLLQQICRYLGISNADMEKGEMRLEANVSVRPIGEKGLPNYRVELKNINSFRFLTNAIDYEIERQIHEMEAGKRLQQETRGWDETHKRSYVQRSKEQAHDYRYFPEPDLPPIFFTQSEIAEIKNQLPELPQEKSKRFIQQYQLSKNYTQILTESLELANYFEKAVKVAKSQNVIPKTVANYLINKKIDIRKVNPREVVKQILRSQKESISDDQLLEQLAQEALRENPEAVSNFKKGKINAIMALVGAVMRKTEGKADAQKVKEILEKQLAQN